MHSISVSAQRIQRKLSSKETINIATYPSKTGAMLKVEGTGEIHIRTQLNGAVQERVLCLVLRSQSSAHYSPLKTCTASLRAKSAGTGSTAVDAPKVHDARVHPCRGLLHRNPLSQCEFPGCHGREPDPYGSDRHERSIADHFGEDFFLLAGRYSFAPLPRQSDRIVKSADGTRDFHLFSSLENVFHVSRQELLLRQRCTSWQN
ncbi:hypothetical protein WN51_07967 [Melipona quadrifasciata]|uniref:Uncharacterized protein n=1 Tax=Melipona quadrifasciata TaxID=166423 RepID=A0A0M8ZR52_9HYME|nr:hypothetical protein WN51_07967 [Melipona quadrifasciata]